MKAFVSIFKDPDEIEVRARAEGAGNAIGDMLRVVRPGGSCEGWTYDALLAHGDGEIDLTAAPVQS